MLVKLLMAWKCRYIYINNKNAEYRLRGCFYLQTVEKGITISGSIAKHDKVVMVEVESYWSHTADCGLPSKMARTPETN